MTARTDSTHKGRHISIEAAKKVSFGALHAVPPLYNEVLQHNANMLLGVRERMVKRRAHRSDRERQSRDCVCRGY